MERTKIQNPRTGRWVYEDGRTAQRFKNYPLDNSKTSWTQKAPMRVSQRQKVMAECGPSCFLQPETLGFPVCNKKPPCAYNRKGITAAYVRAREWKHEDVVKAVKKLRKLLSIP
jgi:hypothetical protein